MIVFSAPFRGLKVTTMYGPFIILSFFLGILQYYLVECYAPGSLIWSRNLQRFIPIDNVSTFGAYQQEFLAKNRENENHNFLGEVLKIGYYQLNNYYNTINFYDNDTKITGICGEIWNILSDYSNFTIVTVRTEHSGMLLDNGSFTETLGMMQRNEIQIIPRISYCPEYFMLMDFTMPIWETRYRLYIQAEWKVDTTWIFSMFPYEVWLAIILLFLLLSVCGYFMQKISIKVSGGKKHRHNLQDHLIYTLATLCDQGYIPGTLDRRIKILGLTKVMFAWLLMIVLSANLISYMMNQKLQPPFTNITSLLDETNYNVSIFYGSMAFDQYKILIGELTEIKPYDRRFHVTTSHTRLYEKACWNERKFAIFESVDVPRRFNTCELVPIGKYYFPTWVTFGVSKVFQYKRTIDNGILKIKESGIMKRLKNYWIDSSNKMEPLGDAPFTSVNFNQVLMLFIILGIGMVATVIIFVLENIVFIYKRNQRRNSCENFLIGKASVNAHRLPA